MQLIENIWDSGVDDSHTIFILGMEYPPVIQQQGVNQTGEFNIKSIFNHHQIELPIGFLDDLKSRVWFTYRTGFTIIPRDPNGPSPLTFSSLMRGTLDLSNSTKGFTTDAGWGCMIRTSQSLLANTLMTLKLGRDWRYNDQVLDQGHWDIVNLFNDKVDCPLSVFKFVDFARLNCGKKPGEWFGPSDAAKSISGLINNTQNYNLGLSVYLTSDSGDIYEDELDFQTPILILSGIRLGIKNVNPIYWEFLKLILSMDQSIGIAGGRPSSSHYFFGYQNDHLLYLDPHYPQKVLHDDPSMNEIKSYLESFHTTKIRRIHLNQLDPSMLVGILVKSREDYDKFKERIEAFDVNGRFLNISSFRPMDDEFIDKVESLNEDFGDYDDEALGDDSMVVIQDRDHEETAHLITNEENIDDPITVPKELPQDPNANEMACDDAIDLEEVIISHDRKFSDSVLISSPN